MTRDKLETSQIEDAVLEVRRVVNVRIRQKGDGAYAGPHETFGIVHEEYRELDDAMRTNSWGNFREELADVAVACIIGMASQFPSDTSQKSGKEEAGE